MFKIYLFPFFLLFKWLSTLQHALKKSGFVDLKWSVYEKYTRFNVWLRRRHFPSVFLFFSFNRFTREFIDFSRSSSDELGVKSVNSLQLFHTLVFFLLAPNDSIFLTIYVRWGSPVFDFLIMFVIIAIIKSCTANKFWLLLLK